MNQLEAQVNDLRSFLAVPSLAAQDGEYSPGPHHPTNQHASPLSAPGDNSAPLNPQSPLEADHPHGAQKSGKRKVDESESLANKQQRSKRNRVSVLSILLHFNSRRIHSQPPSSRARATPPSTATPYPVLELTLFLSVVYLDSLVCRRMILRGHPRASTRAPIS